MYPQSSAVTLVVEKSFLFKSTMLFYSMQVLQHAVKHVAWNRMSSR